MRWKTILEVLLFLAVLATAAALVWWTPVPCDWSETARLEGQLESLRAANRAMQAENQRLERLVKALKDDPEVLEKVARDDLGYIRDGEVVVIVSK